MTQTEMPGGMARYRSTHCQYCGYLNVWLTAVPINTLVECKGCNKKYPRSDWEYWYARANQREQKERDRRNGATTHRTTREGR